MAEEPSWWDLVQEKKKKVEEVRTLNPAWGRTVVLSHVHETKKHRGENTATVVFGSLNIGVRMPFEMTWGTWAIYMDSYNRGFVGNSHPYRDVAGGQLG